MSEKDDLAARRNRKQHNQMLVDRIVGMPAHPGTPESDADPHNPISAGGPAATMAENESALKPCPFLRGERNHDGPQ